MRARRATQGACAIKEVGHYVQEVAHHVQSGNARSR
jgi:hypothetical protein